MMGGVGTWLGRYKLRQMVREAFQKVYDEESGQYYYYNRVNGQVQWNKPTLLGKRDAATIKAEDLTEDQAVRMIQGVWRSSIAR